RGHELDGHLVGYDPDLAGAVHDPFSPPAYLLDELVGPDAPHGLLVSLLVALTEDPPDQCRLARESVRVLSRCRSIAGVTPPLHLDSEEILQKLGPFVGRDLVEVLLDPRCLSPEPIPFEPIAGLADPDSLFRPHHSGPTIHDRVSGFHRALSFCMTRRRRFV